MASAAQKRQVNWHFVVFQGDAVCFYLRDIANKKYVHVSFVQCMLSKCYRCVFACIGISNKKWPQNSGGHILTLLLYVTAWPCYCMCLNGCCLIVCQCVN